MKDLFIRICLAECVEAEITRLSNAELAKFALWLESGHGHGIQGMLLGLCQATAAQRFTEAWSA